MNEDLHAHRLERYGLEAEQLATFAPHLHLMPPIESHDRPAEAYLETVALLRRKPHANGTYINSANRLPVLRVLNLRYRTR
jgi:hypothetical protein